MENDSGCELEIWYNRPTVEQWRPSMGEYTHYGERDIIKNKKNTIWPQYGKGHDVTQGQHVEEPMVNIQRPRTYKPVALLKINKLGVLGGNAERTSGVDNPRRALLS